MKKSVKKESVKNVVTNKPVNIFTNAAILTPSALVHEKSMTKKSVHSTLAAFEENINAAFSLLLKSSDIRSRNTGNAAKGKFQTALQVVANCFPYQTAEGILAVKGKDENGVKVWKEKKLTAAAARGIVRESVNNFIKFVGAPEIIRVEIGKPVE